MEAVDAAAAGRAVDDLGDLFGGSIALGCGTTLLTALVVAFAACVGLRIFCSARDALVRIVDGWFHARERCAAAPSPSRVSGRALVPLLPVLTHHAAKRGPPLLVR
jgi:hypothetical protein